MPNPLVSTGKGLLATNPVKYLLYDGFFTALAAGSVNNTKSESPTSTGSNVVRTVVDAGVLMSVATSALVVSVGAGFNSPNLSYPQQTRVVGKMLLTDFTAPSVPSRLAFGWGTSASGYPVDGIELRNPAIQYSSTTTVLASAYVSATPYKFCVILRGTGAFTFIKGGIFTYWTLLWITAVGSAAMFPAVTGQAAGWNINVKNLRIPILLYIPIPLAYDTFTRADGALGSTETVSPDGVVELARTWNFTVGVWAVVSNVAVGTPGNGADIITNGDFSSGVGWTTGAGWTIAAGVAGAVTATSSLTQATGVTGTWYKATYTLSGFSVGTFQLQFGTTAAVGVADASNATFVETQRALGTAVGIKAVGGTGTVDNVSFLPLNLKDLFSSLVLATQDVIADVAVTSVAALSTQSGVVVNLDSVSTPANFVIAYIDRGLAVARLEKCVAGTYTQVISAAITYSAGAVLRVAKTDTSYSLYYNNVQVGAVSTISDAGIISNLNHGLFSTSPLNSLKPFTLWSRGSADNYYAGLDAF